MDAKTTALLADLELSIPGMVCDTTGDKHPRALGRPAEENWTELWDDLEPLLRSVRETGQTVHAKVSAVSNC